MSSLFVPLPSLRRNRISNRIRCFMLHIAMYSIEGQRRLARDVGVSHSTISRLVRGETAPSFQLAEAVTQALSRRLGVPVSIRDVFTTDGTYPTPCVCDLTPDCKGCFPPEAYTEDGTMKPEYRDLRPSDWCRFPPMESPIDVTQSHTN